MKPPLPVGDTSRPAAGPEKAAPIGSSASLPPGWGPFVPAGESVLASCRYDLDSTGRFASGRIVLTDGRIVADDPATGDVGRPPRVWLLDDACELAVRMRVSFGRLDLLRAGRPEAAWQFTSAKATAVQSLAEAWRCAAGAAAGGRRNRRRGAAGSALTVARR